MNKVIGVTVGTPMNPDKLGGDGAVPDWAKQPEKPKYTAEEVGALSSEICSDRYAINIEPNITRYHLSASAISIINCQDMALIPDGYKAEIIIDNPYGDPTLPFDSDVLKDTSDDGKALTGLNGFVARDGAVLTIYKVRNADKFNWYLSKHGLPISGVAQIGQTIVVKAVNDAMQPTEWECANLPIGGGDGFFELVGEWKTTEEVKSFEVTLDEPLEESWYVVFQFCGTTTNDKRYNPIIYANGRASRYLYSELLYPNNMNTVWAYGLLNGSIQLSFEMSDTGFLYNGTDNFDATTVMRDTTIYLRGHTPLWCESDNGILRSIGFKSEGTFGIGSGVRVYKIKGV